MQTIHAYFNFMGNTEEAMNFYKTVFGGEFVVFSRFKDVPGSEKMPPEEQEKIMHISLQTKGGTLLMATDFLQSMGQHLQVGNQVSLCIQASSEAEVDSLYKALSEGGLVTMPVNKTFWGAYFGMCTDRFGVQWMVNYTLPVNEAGQA